MRGRVKKKTILTWGAIALVALAVAYFAGNRESLVRKPVGYVVCGCLDYDPDNRVYRIDLETGQVLSVSEKLAWMGRPNDIALDADRMRLYVASMRGKSSYDFFPVSIIDFANGQFKIGKQFAIEVDEGRVTWTNRFGKNVVEAYSVVLSPDGSELYVSHGGSDGLRSVLDATSGGVKRRLRMLVRRGYTVFSPDGRYAWNFRPYREWQEEADGVVSTSNQPGISVVYDSFTGGEESRITLNSHKSHEAALLQASQWGPWETPSGPRVRLEKGNLVAYDRDTYNILSRADISEFLDQYGSGYTTVFDDGRRIAMIGEVERQVGTELKDDGFGGTFEWGVYRTYSHAATFNVQSGELLFNTPVGTEIESDYCTNIEVAYE